MKKKRGPEKLFYYLRDKDKRPAITICLLREGTFVARGMAICSHMDQPCRKKGRKQATKRAKRAMAMLIRTARAKEILKECAVPSMLCKTKSFAFDDQKLLSAFERKLLAKANLARAAQPRRGGD